MEEELVVLVDEQDEVLGTCEKLAAHQKGGRLHRAISVFLFDTAGQMLLQRRALEKYHFGGLWSNACCSHPRPGETPLAAAHRRLAEELGVRAELSFAFSFVYRAEDERSGLTEHEFDHVFIGTLTEAPAPNPSEVAEIALAAPGDVLADTLARPERYTPWFRLVLERVLQG